MKRINGYPGCMACGKANPRGFQLELFLDEVDARGEIAEDRRRFLV